MTAPEVDEVVQEFLVESNDNLDQLDSDLVALEQDPGSAELLASVFRAFHTIKGTSGFLGFNRLEELAHAAESLLSKLRDGALVLDQDRAGLLLQVIDALRAMLATIEATGDDAGDDAGHDPATLIARLQESLSDDATPAPARDRHAEEPEIAVTAEPGPESPATAEGPAVAEVGDDHPAGERSEVRPAVAERSVRVDVDLLDALMRQVGELVLARNQIISHAGVLEEPALHQTVQRLSLIVSELQEGVMKTRMQPIDQLWSKLPRVVRDLAAQFDKQVALDMDGGETELDRSLLEAVKDPLTHLVRNAVDHGIESTDVRVQRGKPATGTLSLRAFHEGGQVVMEIGDDGSGIDLGRVAAKAVERGIVTAEQLDRMSEREIVDLVFRPGFSTAATVTNVSGRGVGMDVVRTNIERIGGTVDLVNAPGAGTTFRIKIPLTLAIIPALLVGCRGRRYALPQANLLELVHLDGDAVRNSIEYLGGAAVYRLRGRLLPLIGLDQSLGFADSVALAELDSLKIVVLQADDVLFGLVVDDVSDTQEIVVKPLGRHVKQLPIYAGATILGDGSVALILDVAGLATGAGMRDGASVATPAVTENEAAEEARGATTTIVVLRVGDDRRVAIPLELVARLEEVAQADLERAGGRDVLQYRGDLLPIVRLTEFLGEAERADDDSTTVPVVVYSSAGRQVGLVATEILDIVEEALEVRHVAAGPGTGLQGSAVVQGRVTDLLDVDAVIDSTIGEVVGSGA
ncbi:MAG TPA: chemotaxis protein CheA [Acidimicrobiales bacterium]|nr:chemotaxis protein CheA [Acidimicrobiales bacterium]